MGKKIKKQIFLEELPHKYGIGINKDKVVICWEESIGYKVKFEYDDIKGYIEIIDYDKTTRKLKIKYKDKYFKKHINGFIACMFGDITSKYTKEFKYKIGKNIKDNKRDFVIIDREYRQGNHGKSIVNEKWYKYTCNKCGWTEGWIDESALLRGNGCSCCNGKTIVLGINSIVDTDKWMIPYFQGGYDEAKLYTRASQKYIYPVCPDCGSAKNKRMLISTINTCKSIGCSCGDGISYPNKFMTELLKQTYIKFEIEYSPYWLDSKRYDFYIPYMNLIIEMDGGWHSNDNKMSGQTAQESKIIDNYKDKLAEEHGIQVIRIDCDYKYFDRFEYIKQNIINNIKLNQLFDLSKINWNKCHEFALNNLVKIACEYKRNNLEMSSFEIGKIMGGYNKDTITRWLKQGNGIWCNYNPKEEMKRIGAINGKATRKPIEIFKDNISLGIFESAMYLEIHGEELFETNFGRGVICRVCNGKKPQYKGYTFKYISKKEYEERKLQENLKQAI
jgi:very-short-patch-repair endonuclease